MSELAIERISIKPKREGRPPTQLSITKKHRIGSGTFGTAFQTEVTTGSHARNLVIKKFKNTEVRGFVTTARENAAKAIANYKIAQRAGLKVFPTYRLSEDLESVVMTSGNTDSIICIGTEPASSLPGIGKPKIPSIESVACAELMDGVFNQATLAANHDISIRPDAFFFLYDKSTGGIDFVIGDLDNVHKRQLPPNQSRLLSNLYGAKIALQSFIVDNVDNPGVYLKLIAEVHDETKIAQEYGRY
jgi:hypothetical protein